MILDHFLLMYRMDSLSRPYGGVLSLTLNNRAKRVFIAINPVRKAHRKPKDVTIWLLAPSIKDAMSAIETSLALEELIQ